MQKPHEFGGLGRFDELTTFVAVVDTGSFAAAARELGRDASVLSRRVTQLEERLAVRLLSRTTRRIVLTEAGSIFFERVRGLLDELASAGREATDHAASPRGLVRVSVPVSFGRLWIGPVLPPFLARYPQIRIDLRLSDRLADVVADGFDVAIRVTATAPRDSSLTARKLASYRNLLVASPDYLARRGTPTEPADLAGQACIGFTGFAGWPDWPLTREGHRRTFRPLCTLVVDNSEVALAAARDGAGITFTPDWLAGPALEAGDLVEVLPGWGSRTAGGVHAILPPGRRVPTKTRLFVDEVARAIKAGWSR